MSEKNFSNITNFKGEISEDLKDLVITRIEADMSDDLRLCIGDEEGGLSSDQMIEHIRKGDNIGKHLVQSHLNFIKAQANGRLMTALNSVLE